MRISRETTAEKSNIDDRNECKINSKSRTRAKSLKPFWTIPLPQKNQNIMPETEQGRFRVNRLYYNK